LGGGGQHLDKFIVGDYGLDGSQYDLSSLEDRLAESEIIDSDEMTILGDDASHVEDGHVEDVEA
jgi:hypothetical protein